MLYDHVSTLGLTGRHCDAGFLQPGFSFSQTFTDEEDWTGLKAKVRWYGAKLAAVFLASAAAAAAVAWSLYYLLRTLIS